MEMGTEQGHTNESNEGDMSSEELKRWAGFARIVGEQGSGIDYIVKKHTVILGRKLPNNHTSEADLPLGETKLISRKHAEVRWDSSNKRWEVQVLSSSNTLRIGRENFTSASPPQPLPSRTYLEAAGIKLAFLLPARGFGGHLGWQDAPL